MAGTAEYEELNKNLEIVDGHAVKAPEDYPVNPGTVTSEQKQKKREKLAAANRLREERIQAFYNEEKAEKYPEEKELLQSWLNVCDYQ